MEMSSIDYNSASQPIVQQLASSNWDGHKVPDAVKILSVLAPFDKITYCQDGCKAIRKLHNEIALKVHPDKYPENRDMAHRAFIVATDARDTLCSEAATRELCKPTNSQNDDTCSSVKKAKSTPIIMEELAEQFGIDLQAEGIVTWLRDRKQQPMDLATYKATFGSKGNFMGPPIKLTWEEAFQFVIDWIEKFPTHAAFPMPSGNGANGIDVDIFSALTNLEVANPPFGIDRGSKGYVSWFDMICHVLTSTGYIRKCTQRGGDTIVYR